jgi:hypothetical protein
VLCHPPCSREEALTQSEILLQFRDTRRPNHRSTSQSRHTLASTRTVVNDEINRNDIVYIHNLAEEPGPSQVPRIIKQGSNNSNTYRGATKAVKRGVRRYNTWTSIDSTSGSFHQTDTTSAPLCPYPTDGAYTYRDATPAPTRVLTVNESELDDLLPCLSG